MNTRFSLPDKLPDDPELREALAWMIECLRSASETLPTIEYIRFLGSVKDMLEEELI